MNTIVLASILSPLEDALHGLLFGIQRVTGLPWAWSIIVLTVMVRMAILPLAIVQMRSMRGMQKIAPELQKLKQKHKGDSQKLQAEMMALYKEHGVNPVGSCLPLLFQLPVFMGLFFVLRGFSRNPPAGDLSFLGGFIPENNTFHGIAEHVNNAGWAGWVLIACYVGSQLASTLLMPTGADPQQQMMRKLFMVMPFIFVFFVIRFPVGLMLYWISTNLWTVGQQTTLRKLMGPPPNQPPPKEKRAPRIPKPTGGKGLQGAGALAAALMDGELRSFEAEGTGDDVAAARQEALRSLLELAGAIDEDAVEFVTVSEGERGLMGVGRQPARVLARAQVAAVALGPVAERVRDVVERIAGAIDPQLTVTVAEHGTRVVAVASGGDTARLIGRHGQTIDAVQHLAAAAALPGSDGEWEIMVDTAGYRARRERRLRGLAQKAAARALREGRPQALEPMSSAERRIVHTVLLEHDGVETASEGRDPARFVVVRPRGD